MTCLFSKACVKECWLWHKKLCHLNFKAMNQLMKKNLLIGLPKVEFTKDGLCDAFQKGKQRKTSFKSNTESSIDERLQVLHMDLFGLVNIMSISKKKYCLVIVNDFRRFSGPSSFTPRMKQVSSSSNTSKLLIMDQSGVFKKIRSDNGTEFKNSTMKEFYNEKGITHTFSAPRTPQQRWCG